jgi:hypothetical protein
VTMHIKSRFLRCLFFGVILAAAQVLDADELMDRLVGLVGRDAGLCVEVSRLDENLSAFEQGEFFKRLENSKIYAEWKMGSQYRRIAELAAVVEKNTGKPARQFVREIFGSAVVVAAYSESGPKMSAILMSQAISHEALDAAIAAWNRVETPHIEAIQYSGHTYYRRLCTPKPGREAVTLYYGTLDRTLLLSDREELVQLAISLSNRSAPKASLLDLPAYQQARRALGAECAARAYFNPRAFDAMLGIGAHSIDHLQGTPQAAASQHSSVSDESAKVANSPVCQTIQAAWRRCEWLALGVQVDRGIVFEGVAQYRTDGISDSAQRLIRAMSGPPEFLRLVPADAFVVLACRQPFGTFLRHLLIGQAKEQHSADWDSFRQVSRGVLLGLDLIDDVLPAFRENFGGYLAPGKGLKQDELPFEGLLAAELPIAEASAKRQSMSSERAATLLTTHHAEMAVAQEPGSAMSGTRPSVRDAIDNGLNMGLNFAAAYFNMRATGAPAVVRSERSQGRETRIRWIEGLGPYEPAYALTSRFLVLATSPRAARNFAKADANDHAQSVGQTAGFRIPPAIEELAKRYFPSENQILFIDTAAIRRFLHAHGPQLVQHAIRVGSIPPAHAEKTLAKFLDVTGLFDTVFAAARVGDGSARLVIGGIVNGPADRETAAAR